MDILCGFSSSKILNNKCNICGTSTDNSNFLKRHIIDEHIPFSKLEIISNICSKKLNIIEHFFPTIYRSINDVDPIRPIVSTILKIKNKLSVLEKKPDNKYTIARTKECILYIKKYCKNNSIENTADYFKQEAVYPIFLNDLLTNKINYYTIIMFDNYTDITFNYLQKDLDAIVPNFSRRTREFRSLYYSSKKLKEIKIK
jgi:hypothetical protein